MCIFSVLFFLSVFISFFGVWLYFLSLFFQALMKGVFYVEGWDEVGGVLDKEMGD